MVAGLCRTALSAATERGDHEMMKLLLQHGANPAAQSGVGITVPGFEELAFNKRALEPSLMLAVSRDDRTAVDLLLV